MRSIFPSLFVKSDDLFEDKYWKSLLHCDFTREERERIHKAGLEIKTFLADAREWDLARKDHFEKIG